jgi:hypothetical protein
MQLARFGEILILNFCEYGYSTGDVWWRMLVCEQIFPV